MNTIKRTDEQTAIIRRVAYQLKGGQKNSLLNAAARLEKIARRTEDLIPVNEEIEHRYSSTKMILSALLAGRTLSYLNRVEFHTTVWHTRIDEVRKIVARNYPNYTFCSQLKRGTNCNYKIYWLESNI